MSALLWTLIAVGGINTVCALIVFGMGYSAPVTQGARVISAIYTAGIAVWALTLLLKGPP